MQQKYFGMIMLMLAGLMVVPMAQAQKYDITPVNLDSIWNRVIWFQDDDPNISNGGPGIKVSTLPPDVIPGQVNVSEDGMVSFLLPDMTIGNPNAYYGVTGDTVSVPEGKYQYVFMASTADDGPWPGECLVGGLMWIPTPVKFMIPARKGTVSNRFMMMGRAIGFPWVSCRTGSGNHRSGSLRPTATQVKLSMITCAIRVIPTVPSTSGMERAIWITI